MRYPLLNMQESPSATEEHPAVQPWRLHWGWVLALSIFTGLLFYGVWLIVQSHWSRKMRGRSLAFPLAIFLFAAQLGSIFLLPGHYYHLLCVFGFYITDNASDLYAAGWLFAILLRIAHLFILRAELSGNPISIDLSKPMTFFFGPVYFQYHLQDYQGAPLEAIQGLGITRQPKHDSRT